MVWSTRVERSRALPTRPFCAPGFVPGDMFGEALFFAKPPLDGDLPELWPSLDNASSSATRADKQRTYAINGNNKRMMLSFCA